MCVVDTDTPPLLESFEENLGHADILWGPYLAQKSTKCQIKVNDNSDVTKETYFEKLMTPFVVLSRRREGSFILSVTSSNDVLLPTDP
ncbi:hypothetical protein NPIL_198621 [Nephila pilipes]|uniref:Uncharacterized protein n=1 Tax=Nephila pilipes TaxID=299642 RepID=A0A8X6QSM7_NEPPI|nr:hypothetical protein NPIL_198621 [Nephila pilipes]